jgi:cytochrome bd-type quinol oxidase subunit 2
VDVIHGLAARYCVRQDARGIVELWGLLVALTAGTVAILRFVRHGSGDRTRRRVAVSAAAALACFIVLTVGVGGTIFRWCYESAAPSLGFVAPDTPRGIDALVCLSPHAVGMMNGWILIVLTCLVAIGLLALGIVRCKGAARRALAFGGAGAAFLCALAGGGLMLFSISWCQSQRLF